MVWGGEDKYEPLDGSYPPDRDDDDTLYISLYGPNLTIPIRTQAIEASHIVPAGGTITVVFDSMPAVTIDRVTVTSGDGTFHVPMINTVHMQPGYSLSLELDLRPT